MQTTLKLQSLPFGSYKTYILASAFVLGNILFPHIAHFLPMGGPTWLPIYFFTLVGAYIFGWRVGLLTAILSPLANSVLFGMPAVALLPAIFLKSLLLALSAGWAARHWGRVTLSALISVVLSYQILGTLGEWAMLGDFSLALQDFRIGVPGLLVQIFGGYALIRCLTRG